MYVSQDLIEAMLAGTYRTDRLYPDRVKALGILRARNYFEDVTRRIVEPLTEVASLGAAHQFIRDFDTYGLFEAIVYLHAIDFRRDPTEFMASTVDFYSALSEEYRLARASLATTDDPEICQLLDRLHERGGGDSHNLSSLHDPRVPPTAEEDASEANALADSVTEIAPNRALSAVLGSLLDEPFGPRRLRTDEVAAEAIGFEWMFHGTPSMMDMPFKIAEMTSGYAINPLGSAGRRIMSEVLDLVRMEAFGDYARSARCWDCDEEFFVGGLSVELFVRVLQAGCWRCASCGDAGEQRAE